MRPIPGIERLFCPALEVLDEGLFEVVPSLGNMPNTNTNNQMLP